MFGLILLGMSLAIKHDLVFVPLWLALRGPWRQRLLVLTVPYAVWFCAFLPPVLAGSAASVWHNVVQFRGFANAPLYNMLIPPQVLHVVPPFVLFVGAMCVAGWVTTRNR